MEKELAEGVKNLGKVLNKYHVDYMFVGGIAIAYFGTPRPSANMPKDVDYDVDIWYKATNTNFLRLVKAISHISPELNDDLQKIIFDPKKTFIKFSLDRYHFDFLPELVAFHHNDFNKCYKEREEGEIDGIKINILSRKDLLFDKEKLGRDKDLADIENIKKRSFKGFSR